MFYIKKQRSTPTRDLIFVRVLPAFIVFLAFFSLTLWSAYVARKATSESQHTALLKNSENTTQVVQQRINSYSDILRASVGLFRASDTVTRNEWKEFIDGFDIPHRYPGIQALGVIDVITVGELNNYTEKVRTDDLPDFTLIPKEPSRPVYTSVIYIEPFTGRNVNTIGNDIHTEAKRAFSMDEARDSGQPTTTDALPPFLNTNSDPSLRFLIFMPTYRKGSNPNTIEERRKNIKGYIFAGFRIRDLIDNIVKNQDPNYAFRIYDKNTPDKQMVYESTNYATIASTKNNKTLVTQLQDNSWVIESRVSSEIVPSSERQKSANTLSVGLLFSLFVAGFIYLLSLNRYHALTHKEEREIQDAKDELLALASHQLRTPATGVKQYVGMLLEGYAGILTATQLHLLQKAYESNERQLSTINEMLFVARADAGNLKMETSTIDIRSLVENVISEQKSTFKNRNQKISVRIPRRSIPIQADGQYLYMAIENIVSNATKYTPPGGKLKINLTSKKDEILFTVEDNGVGVDKKDKDLLFKKFSRIPNELTNQVSGSGIGLYLAKQVIDQHGGSIEFIPAAVKGSIFVIHIPKKQKKESK